MSEPAFRLVRTNGPEAFDLEIGNRYVLGRGPSSDFPVPTSGDGHNLRAAINGGGPLLHLRTSGGGIRIQKR